MTLMALRISCFSADSGIPSGVLAQSRFAANSLRRGSRFSFLKISKTLFRFEKKDLPAGTYALFSTVARPCKMLSAWRKFHLRKDISIDRILLSSCCSVEVGNDEFLFS